VSSWFALPIPTRCPLAMPVGQTSATAAGCAFLTGRRSFCGDGEGRGEGHDLCRWPFSDRNVGAKPRERVGRGRPQSSAALGGSPVPGEELNR